MYVMDDLRVEDGLLHSYRRGETSLDTTYIYWGSWKVDKEIWLINGEGP